MTTFHIGLWGTEYQSTRSWVVDAQGNPVCMVDESADRSVSSLRAKGLSVVPEQGETIETLIALKYLET